MLCVLVVFIHNQINSVNFAGETIRVKEPIVFEAVRIFISGYLGAIAVPLFFFISGYLLFKKDDPYPVMLKKKARSLVVPYFLWNALFFVVYYFAQQFPVIKQFIRRTIASNIDIKELARIFFGRYNEFGPGNFPPAAATLWFVRDLFLCVVFSPVIKWLVKRMPAFSLVAVLLFAQSELLYGGIRRALFYFTLGGLAVRFDLSYKNIARIRFWDIGVLFALIIILRFYFHFSTQTAASPLGVLNVLVGGVLLLKISGRVCEDERAFAALKYLSQFTFWIFATHYEIVAAIKKLWWKFMPLNGVSFFVEYFGGTALCVGICMGAALLVKRIAPKVYAVFTGGRA